jgi:hypothetical protein
MEKGGETLAGAEKLEQNRIKSIRRLPRVRSFKLGDFDVCLAPHLPKSAVSQLCPVRVQSNA